MSHSDGELAANVARFRGSLDAYDQCRPAPPEIIGRLIQQFAGISHPNLVVDLGCGTGLSTRFWSTRARQVVGIEPSAEMLKVAHSKTTATNTTFKQAFSHQTSLANASADIVTCCQSLHWMDPDRTIAEVARILRPGGVWAIVDYDLPLINAEVNRAIRDTLAKSKEKTAALKLEREQKHWPDEHASRIEKSGRFRQVIETGATAVDTGDSARLMGLVRSLGTVSIPLKHCSDIDLGLHLLEDAARRNLDGRPLDWFWNYRVILAVK